MASAVIATGTTITYAAATDSVMVIDVSGTISDGSQYNKSGGSIVIDFENDEANFYSHNGLGVGGEFGVTYSVGLVSNYEESNDYAGDFIDVSVVYNQYGMDHCWNPWGDYTKATKATSITFSWFSTGLGWSFGYDYYAPPTKLFGW